MAKNRINFETVRQIALALPGVEESTAYGSPAFKVRGKLLACIPAHRSAEPGSLVVCVDLIDRAELLARAPGIYYVTDHYAPYESVLVRLSQLNQSRAARLARNGVQLHQPKSGGPFTAAQTPPLSVKVHSQTA